MSSPFIAVGALPRTPVPLHATLYVVIPEVRVRMLL